jgi:4-hydroxybenzoate polyprenyltransferase
MKLTGFIRACHPGPTVVMTVLITLVGWGVGWHGVRIIGLGIAVLLGQLSVGWSNDAHDARMDFAAGREAKPTVSGHASARVLWPAALCALLLSVALSWIVAGWVGGSFHVLALAMAWLYNLRLSRTAWSWLPYAVAFAALPPFLSYGSGNGAPPVWLLVVFPVIGVSAHLANALPDVETDRSGGLGGTAVHLGVRRTAVLCWVLLAVASVILAAEAVTGRWWLAVVVAAGYVGAAVYARLSSSRASTFHALMGAVAVDAVVLVLVGV